MRSRIWLFFIFASLVTLLSACNLAGDDPTPTPTQIVLNNPTAIPTGKPTVTITSPNDGSTFEVGRDILVSVTASDVQGVTRIQLLANGQVVKNVLSESELGDKTKSALLDYRPTANGVVQLQVIAYRATTASDPATINITVGNSAQVTGLPTFSSTAVVIPTQTINFNDPTCRVQVTTTILNIRAEPNTSSAIAGRIPNGQIATIQQRLGDNSWYQINYNGVLGWVFAELTARYGTCNNIPVFSPIPSVTITPFWTATFVPTLTQQPSLTPTPGTPDLLLARLSGPDVVRLNEGEASVTVEYSITITNIGTANTGEFTLYLHAMRDETLEIAIDNLRPGESVNFTPRLSFTQTGNYTIVAEADRDNRVTREVNKTNNIATRPLSVTR